MEFPKRRPAIEPKRQETFVVGPVASFAHASSVSPLRYPLSDIRSSQDAPTPSACQTQARSILRVPQCDPVVNPLCRVTVP